MKKLMTLMLGLSLVIGSVAVTFAASKDETTARKKGGKKAAPKDTKTSNVR
jgi:hypothetical protein